MGRTASHRPPRHPRCLAQLCPDTIKPYPLATFSMHASKAGSSPNGGPRPPSVFLPPSSWPLPSALSSKLPPISSSESQHVGPMPGRFPAPLARSPPTLLQLQVSFHLAELTRSHRQSLFRLYHSPTSSLTSRRRCSPNFFFENILPSTSHTATDQVPTRLEPDPTSLRPDTTYDTPLHTDASPATQIDCVPTLPPLPPLRPPH